MSRIVVSPDGRRWEVVEDDGIFLYLRDLETGYETRLSRTLVEWSKVGIGDWREE